MLLSTKTTGDCLAQLLAINSWMHVGLDKEGKPYGPGFFARRNWGARLNDKNRKVAFRLRNFGRCLGCDAHVPETSTGDHLIPTSEGGPDDASNYAPLCLSCNASKGKRDFFEWWRSKHYHLKNLPYEVVADLICAYARLSYQKARTEETLGFPASSHLLLLLEEAKLYVPKSHWTALSRVGING